MMNRRASRPRSGAPLSALWLLPGFGPALLAACVAFVDVNVTVTGTGETSGAATEPTGGTTGPVCAGGSGETTCPASCVEVLGEMPGAADGEYTLYVDGDAGRPWQAWCADMHGTPAEYLLLSLTGPGYNYSEYVPGAGQASVTPVRTTYSRVRIDPHDLLVDVGDKTFSSSSGQLMHGDTLVTSMPYGAAMDCVTTYSMSGRGNIDLRGTPFTASTDQFFVDGYAAEGMVASDPKGQVIDLYAGGACGYILPEEFPEFMEPVNNWGDFYLQLEYAPPVSP